MTWTRRRRNPITCNSNRQCRWLKALYIKTRWHCRRQAQATFPIQRIKSIPLRILAWVLNPIRFYIDFVQFDWTNLTFFCCFKETSGFLNASLTLGNQIESKFCRVLCSNDGSSTMIQTIPGQTVYQALKKIFIKKQIPWYKCDLYYVDEYNVNKTVCSLNVVFIYLPGSLITNQNLSQISWWISNRTRRWLAPKKFVWSREACSPWAWYRSLLICASRPASRRQYTSS